MVAKFLACPHEKSPYPLNPTSNKKFLILFPEFLTELSSKVWPELISPPGI